MNVQIISNSVNRMGNTNYTNDFTMSLPQHIDGENSESYITVLNVSYPLTTKNVLENECTVYLKMSFSNYNNVAGAKYDKQFPTVIFPPGVYTLDMIVRLLNSHYNDYGISFVITEYGRTRITINPSYGYFFKQFKSSTGQAIDGGVLGETRYIEQNNFVEYSIVFSNKLKFILGFNDNEVRATKFLFNDVGVLTLFSNNLCNITDGINNIYIYCDEVENSLVGDTVSQLLCIVPLQIEGQGSGDIYSFSPPRIKRKLIRKHIDSFHIVLRDSIGKLIPFDSGNVIITCLVEK